MADPTFFDVVRSQRGIRFFKPDPVSQDDVDRILRAAVRAPSASNKQDWAFIVIRDPGVKRELGELYREGQARSRGAGSSAPPPAPQPGHFAHDMEHVPVVIMACIANGGAPTIDMVRAASIYPAAQNLMLAAAALGLGTRLTTIWHSAETEIKELLGIPDDYSPAALIPLGYPAEPDHLGGSIRQPIAEVTFNDRWGNRPSAG
ncbi:MAG: nitroreductase family protein [Chloroflexi bacterium]|nr:nitroreductase family protein [Chloroflexota bacterium]